nr:hypothetical protein CFP56_41735 [Quercus suber]
MKTHRGWIGVVAGSEATISGNQRCEAAISGFLGVDRRSPVRSCDLWVSRCGTAISGAKAAISEWWNGISSARW